MLDKPAFDGVSYGQLHEQVLKTIYWLQKQGLRSGDVVCVQLPKSVELLQVILASMAMGSPILPLNEAYTDVEVLYYLNDCKPTLSILPKRPNGWNGVVRTPVELLQVKMSPSADLPSEVPLSSQALFLYTSGTTGEPKGAVISHQNILACVKALHQAWQWTAEDHLLHILPLFHVHGLIVAQFGALYANARTSWLLKFDASAVWRLISLREISILMAVPTIHYRLLKEQEYPDTSSLRLVTSGSAPLPVSLHEQFFDRFGFQIVERYGMTEVGIVLSNPYAGECRPGTVGFPLGDTQFRIVGKTGEDLPDGEVGELWIKGSSVISEYWERPEQSKETIHDGWLRSGDLAVRDFDGYYSIVGRAKDLIISGGMNVYPREVERCLLKHASVDEVAVIGLPDEEWGEQVTAIVVGQPQSEQLLAFVRGELSSYKCPKQIFYVEDFPRNAMGKIQKARLREKYAKQ